MSQAETKPRRWWIEDNEANRYVPSEGVKHRYIEVIPFSAYDVIKAELSDLKFLWNEATKHVMPGEFDTAESIVEFIKRKDAEIARQAKVIEKLKGMVPHYETCAMADSYDDEIVPCDCGLNKELEAIEKGEK